MSVVAKGQSGVMARFASAVGGSTRRRSSACATSDCRPVINATAVGTAPKKRGRCFFLSFLGDEYRFLRLGALRSAWGTSQRKCGTCDDNLTRPAGAQSCEYGIQFK